MRRIRMLEYENEQLKMEGEISELEHRLSNERIDTSPLQDLGTTRIIPEGNRRIPCSSTPRIESTRARVHTKEKDSTILKRHKASKGTSVKAATYDGITSWINYRAHFEACADINGWTIMEKGQYLAVSLRGQAQGVFGNLSSNSRDYDTLVKALEERFAPPNQTELYRVQLRERRQKASETLSELGQEIRRLTNLAYPSAPADIKETLAKEQFIDSLVNVDMRLRIKQARPTDLNDAVRHGVELEAFNRAERSKLEGQIEVDSKSENLKLTS